MPKKNEILEMLKTYKSIEEDHYSLIWVPGDLLNEAERATRIMNNLLELANDAWRKSRHLDPFEAARSISSTMDAGKDELAEILASLEARGLRIELKDDESGAQYGEKTGIGIVYYSQA